MVQVGWYGYIHEGDKGEEEEEIKEVEERRKKGGMKAVRRDDKRRREPGLISIHSYYSG